jgi:hypothetical protein
MMAPLRAENRSAPPSGDRPEEYLIRCCAALNPDYGLPCVASVDNARCGSSFFVDRAGPTARDLSGETP